MVARSKKVGFIGLGKMGALMAGRLLDAGFPLVVYNRTGEKSAELIKRGARGAQSPKETASSSDVTITMLSDDEAVRAVAEGETGMFAGARPGSVFIDCSTISVKTTRDLASQAESLKCHWIDAPVLGNPAAAKSGDLPFVIGGSKAIAGEHRDIFETLGKKIVWIGESGMGQAAKLVHNMACAASLVAYSESILLGEKLGLTRKQVLETLAGGALGSPLLTAKTPKLESNSFEPSFTLALMAKDVGLAQGAAKEFGLGLLILNMTHELYSRAKARGLGEQDSSAVIQALD